MEALFGRKSKKKENNFGIFKRKTEKSEHSGSSFIEERKADEPKQSIKQQMQNESRMSGIQMINMDEDDKTEIGDIGEGRIGGAYLELMESAIPGAVPIIKLNFAGPFITIGRISSDETKPDVAFGREFNKIGRKHARIQKTDRGYAIVDLGSLNHTLLNGQVLIPNEPYMLSDGDELMFTTSSPVKYKVYL